MSQIIISHDDVARQLVKEKKAINDRLRELAELREPLTMADICADRCNIQDREIEGEVRRLRARFDAIDVSDLGDENGNHDVEKWEHVAGGHEPFEVVERKVVPDGAREITWTDADGRKTTGCIVGTPGMGDGELVEYDVKYDVIDTDNGDGVIGTYEDEDDAETERDDRNRVDREESLCGFPFAQTYGYVIDGYDVDDFAACGFLVWRYHDKLIAGIDGGGYSMEGAHWAPLLHRKAVRGGWLIETETGPRRVA